MKFKIELHKTALHIAVQKGNFEIVNFLLSNKAININEKDEIEDLKF